MSPFQPPSFLDPLPSAIPAWEKLAGIIGQKKIDRSRIIEFQQDAALHLLRTSRHIKEPNFASISDQDLGILFHFIDETFFEGTVASLCEKISCRPLRFRLSTRMTSTGGTTTMRRKKGESGQKHFEIAVATTPLFETFKLETQTTVGGLPCHSRLEALQRIMEHEMVHLIEMLLWENSSCQKKPFKHIVQRFFRHAESNHRMLTPKDIAYQTKGLKPGDTVSFVARDTLYHGVVNRIAKRATVLVPSPDGRPFSDGQRYLKYYVPLHFLQRTDRNKGLTPE